MKNFHLFHLVNRSPWPIITATGGWFFTTGLAFTLHRVENGTTILTFSILILIIAAFFWFNEIIEEATFLGYHTKVVRYGIKLGFWLFLVSEMMLFFGFFWALFHSAMVPAEEIGVMWPPYGLKPIYSFGYPLFNTLLLISSGVAVTWAHKGMSLSSYKESLDGLFITLLLGAFFVFLQVKEYYHASFNINDGIYSSTFFMLTGLHGCHVIIGVVLLFVCFLRILSNHFLNNHYAGYVFAIWYWHFVDIVWIVVFLTVYVWATF